MPFVQPKKVNAKLPISRFETVEDTRSDSEDFRFQKRKQAFRFKDKKLYRIVTRHKQDGCRFQVANGDDLDSMLTSEWKYIKEELPKVLPRNLSEKERTLWIIAHITQLALENAKRDEDEKDIPLSKREELADSSPGAPGARTLLSPANKSDVDAPADDESDSDNNPKLRGQAKKSRRPRRSVTLQSQLTALAPLASPVPFPRRPELSGPVVVPSHSQEQSKPKSESSWPDYGFKGELFLLVFADLLVLVALYDWKLMVILLNCAAAVFFWHRRKWRQGKQSQGTATTGSRHSSSSGSAASSGPSERSFFPSSTNPVRSSGNNKKQSVPVEHEQSFSSDMSDDDTSTSLQDHLAPLKEEDDDHRSEHEEPGKSHAPSTSGTNAAALLQLSIPKKILGHTLKKFNESAADSKENGWEDLDCKTFDVRALGYLKLKMKKPSLDSLFDLYAIDIFVSNDKVSNIAAMMDLPNHAARSKACPEQKFDSFKPAFPEWFIVNVQVPDYAPPAPLWGKKKEDGPGYNLVFSFLLSNASRELLKGDSSNALRLLHRFIDNVENPSDPKSDIRKQFKAISRVMNADEAIVNQAAKTLVHKYNGTPFLIRTCSNFFRGELYFEVDVDVHRFSYMARLGLSMLKDSVKNLIWDFGFVIQGNPDDELPEQMLGAARFVKIDPMSSGKPFFPASIAAAGEGD